MKLPLEIVSRDMELTPAIEATIRERGERLDRYCPEIMRCRVVIEIPHRHQQKGRLYDVRLDITVPGSEIVVKREPDQDFNVAVREAFSAAERQLRSYAERRRGECKRHEEQPRARVRELFADEGYGFIESADGREIYFHRNAVLNDRFDSLAVGDPVRFVEEMGDKGPQASTVEAL